MAVKDRPGLEVAVTPAAIGAFLCLLGLCYQAHELGHHLFGGRRGSVPRHRWNLDGGG